MITQSDMITILKDKNILYLIAALTERDIICSLSSMLWYV